MAQLEAGTTLAGRYQLEECIGSGGFGQTWRALDTLLDLQVAIKVYAEVDEAAKARCLREARLLASQTRNTGVVAVRDLVDTGEQILLVMEYLDGQDLRSYLQVHGALGCDQVLALLSPIAHALTQMHGQGLLHRDVSPDNIFVLQDGTAKLIDFGSALKVAANATQTIAVKPGYAPPEQYGSPQDQGPWTDTYSLAATIYHCLTGQAPMDALQRTFHDDMPNAGALGADIRPAVDAGLMRGLALDYRQRTQTPAELIASLRTEEEILSGGIPVEGAPWMPDAPMSSDARQTPANPTSSNASQVAVPVATAPANNFNAPAQAVPTTSPVEPAPQTPSNTVAVQHEQATMATTSNSADEQSHTKRARRAERADKRTSGSAGNALRKSAPWKLIAIGAAALVTVFLALALFRPGSGGLFGGGSSSRTTTLYYDEQAVDAATIQALHRSEDLQTISFTKCDITEDALEELAQFPSLNSVKFDSCTCPSFDALAGCESLRILSFNNEGLDGEADFSAEFPYVENLWFTNVEFSSDMSFLERFPALNWLILSPVAGVEDIELLSLVPQLEKLDISGIDLSGGKDAPLAYCPGLTDLKIDACNPDSLEVVGTLESLSFFSARACGLTSIEPLQACTNLHVLYLTQNDISSIEALASAPDIWYLDIVGNQLTSLAGLEPNTALEELYADYNQIEDASALTGCSELERVSLSHNAITDLSCLDGASSLRRLDVSYNQLPNLDFCETLIKLEEFSASHNQIVDTTKLATCARMTKLALADNQITDISALANGFSSLQYLDLGANAISSLTSLEGCSALVGLSVYDNELRTLDGMAGKPKLEYLLADGNHITDISALATSSGVLRALDLGNNEVSSVAALSSLFSESAYDVGVTLLLDHNQLVSVDELPIKPNYYLITLFGNPLESIDFLKREDMRWSVIYIPYIAETDYSDLFMTQKLPAPLCIVGAPYDRQAQLLDDAKSLLFEPKFYTEEEADALAAEKRQALHDEVSGKSETKLVTVDEGV